MELCRKSVVVLVAGMTLLAPARADDALIREFATCTGRLSAEVEHAWLVGDPRVDVKEALRDNMESLLMSIVGPANDVRAMSLRLDAKVAHRGLLFLADFTQDDGAAYRARKQSEAFIAGCTAYLLV
jgi:hypothetical protein